MSLTYSPCLCGASDCPRCHPESHAIVACSVCGKDYTAHRLTPCAGDRCEAVICEACLAETGKLCEACVEKQNT